MLGNTLFESTYGFLKPFLTPLGNFRFESNRPWQRPAVDLDERPFVAQNQKTASGDMTVGQCGERLGVRAGQQRVFA
jgi:hypothetical protein